MKLAFTPEAEEQAEACDHWWREHRDAKDLFARELAVMQARLLAAPDGGSMYTVLNGLAVRRVLLGKTRTHVYYSVDVVGGTLLVLAVWGARKEREPPL